MQRTVFEQTYHLYCLVMEDTPMKPRTISRTDLKVLQHLRDHPGVMLFDLREAVGYPHAAQRSLYRMKGFGLAAAYRLHEEQGNGCFGWKLTAAGVQALTTTLQPAPGQHGRLLVPSSMASPATAGPKVTSTVVRRPSLPPEILARLRDKSDQACRALGITPSSSSTTREEPSDANGPRTPGSGRVGGAADHGPVPDQGVEAQAAQPGGDDGRRDGAVPTGRADVADRGRGERQVHPRYRPAFPKRDEWDGALAKLTAGPDEAPATVWTVWCSDGSRLAARAMRRLGREGLVRLEGVTVVREGYMLTEEGARYAVLELREPMVVGVAPESRDSSSRG